MTDLINQYSSNFKHLRLLNGIHRTGNMLVLEAETYDGRYLMELIPKKNADYLERQLKDWSPSL